MTHRLHVLAAVLLTVVVTASSALAAHPISPSSVTSTRDTTKAENSTLGFLTPPSATEFASLVTASTASAQDSVRLENVNCVRASRIDYMCSYVVTSPFSPRSCHLIEARWTPEWTSRGVSLYTVTLAGRVTVCDTLRDALRSLH